MKVDRLLASSFMGAALLGMAACGGEGSSDGAPEATSSQAANCVQLAAGQYYWDGAGFVVAPSPQPLDDDPAVQSQTAAIGWAADLERSFSELGFPWMGLRARESVAVLTGLAPVLSAKERGLSTGEAAVDAYAADAGLVTLVVDGIGVESGQRGPGESLATLIEQGSATLETCQTAFDTALNGRTILFQSDLAVVSPASGDLLDALTGIAMLCDDFRIEIGGHTDSRGSEAYNESVSQQRADAVAAYMTEKGVLTEALVARGYGESRPIDPTESYEAWAKNRRMEFKISKRQ